MSTTARRAAMAIFALHGLLLVATLPDYFVGIDSGYHVSLARWYGEHGSAWWDHINFGPGGRPNLQGPLLHMAIGYLGRALGGDGMDYVRANAILALMHPSRRVHDGAAGGVRGRRHRPEVEGARHRGRRDGGAHQPAVFVPMSFEGGHWVEVQPRAYAARQLSAGVKVYAFPAPPDDPVLRDLSDRGFLTIHGGTWLNSIVTLPGPAPLEAAARSLARVGSEQAAWLARYAENNRMPNVRELLSTEAVIRYRARAREQRTRAGRIKAAILVYAFALENVYPDRAAGVRGAARGFGEMANLLGDEATLDFRSEADHRQLQANLAEWSREIRGFDTQVLPTPEMDRITDKLFKDYFR